MIIECSESFLSLFGFESTEWNELIGTNGFNLLIEYNSEKFKQYFEELLEKGFLNDKEGIFTRKDGSQFVGSVNLSMVNDASKKPLYIIGIIRDITHQKEIEKTSLEKEKLLQQSEERSRMIIDSIVHIILEVDIKGNVLYISPQVYQILGYHPEKLFGKDGYDLLHPEDKDRVLKVIENAVTFNKQINIEFRLRHKNGHYLPMLLYANIKEINGELRIIGSLIDLTDKKDNEMKLRVSEEKYRRLYETAQVGFWTSRIEDDEIINANDKMASIVGLTRAEDITETRLTDYIKEEQVKKLHDLLQEFGIVSNFEARLANPSGIKKTISITARLFKDINYGYVIEGFMIEITYLKKTKDALKQSQEMFQLVLNNIPQFIFWKDINSCYLGCNENFARVAGVRNPEDIVGKTDKDLVWQEEEVDFIHETDALVIESNCAEFHIMEQQLQADGKHAWLDTNKIPLHDTEGNVVGLLGTFEDITERINGEIAIKKSEAKYREAFQNANLLKDLFSHDINNILQSIQTANEIYDLEVKKNNYKKLNEISDIIKMQINRGAKLVNNIRKLSLLENSEIPLEPISVFDVLDDSIERIKSMFPHKKIIFQKKSVSNELKCHANEFLHEIFDNILLNAIIYNDKKIIKIKINITRETRNEKKFIIISIRDNGIGIEDIRKETIFQRIYNKDKTISGVGLGLSLVKKIVESYEGEIWIEDVLQGDPSKGSKFIILIPEALITMKF